MLAGRTAATPATERDKSAMVPTSCRPEKADSAGHTLRRIIEILQSALGEEKCAAWLFGSRAIGRAHDMSDFDIAVRGQSDISAPLSLAREMLEESTIPQTVDLIDLADAPPELGEAVSNEGILLWQTD